MIIMTILCILSLSCGAHNSHFMNMYMKYVYNMYKYETVSLVNREVPQLFRICGQSSAPRRKIGQRERICKASSRIISLLEGAFAPTTRKWWEEGGGRGGEGRGVLCKEFKTERSRWEKRKRTRRNEMERRVERSGNWDRSTVLCPPRHESCILIP